MLKKDTAHHSSETTEKKATADCLHLSDNHADAVTTGKDVLIEPPLPPEVVANWGKLAKEFQQLHFRLGVDYWRTFIQIGHELKKVNTEVKRLYGGRAWDRFCREALGFKGGRSRPNRIIKVSTNPFVENETNWCHFPAHWTTVEKLVKLRGDVLKQAMQDSRVNPLMEPKDFIEIKAQSKYFDDQDEVDEVSDNLDDDVLESERPVILRFEIAVPQDSYETLYVPYARFLVECCQVEVEAGDLENMLLEILRRVETLDQDFIDWVQGENQPFTVVIPDTENSPPVPLVADQPVSFHTA